MPIGAFRNTKAINLYQQKYPLFQRRPHQLMVLMTITFKVRKGAAMIVSHRISTKCCVQGINEPERDPCPGVGVVEIILQ